VNLRFHLVYRILILSDSTPSHLDGEKIESEDDEEKRKRKRSLDENEVETELKESPQTPQKLQKTE